MQITDMLAQMGGLQSMARELGVSESLAQTQPAGIEGLGGLLGGLLGGQSVAGASGCRFASMLDMNGDGNALADIMRLAGKALR